MAQASEIEASAESGSAYTFDPFSRHQFYTNVNRSLIEHAIELLTTTHPAGDAVRIVELASGTGAVTELILDALERRERTAEVVGVEPSPIAIRVAEERLEGRPVRFVRGDAEDLRRAIGEADAVFFCNAIHLVPDKDEAVANITSVLRPGGLFAANSSFYTGAYAEGSERFYHLWIRYALDWLREHHPDAPRSRHGKTTAMQWLTPEEYAQVMERHGLRMVFEQVETCQMPLRAWQDIGRYSLFIEGALKGVPVPIGADALEAAAARAFEDLGIHAVPRNWLQMVSRKVDPRAQ